jgi:NCS1 family nucleobase:cation symporter-1
MSHSRDEELDSKHSSHSRGKYKAASSKSFSDAENAPLLAGPSTEFEGFRRRHSTDSLDAAFNSPSLNFPHEREHRIFHSSDEPYFFDFIMEKVKSTKFAHFVDKLAVEVIKPFSLFRFLVPLPDLYFIFQNFKHDTNSS